MKFPKRLRHRGKGPVLATIYDRWIDKKGEVKGDDEKPDLRYRLNWRAKVGGKPVSRTKDLATYASAKREGDTKVAELVKGFDQTLTPGQTSDAIAALEALHGHYLATGERLSLRAAVADYCALKTKLRPTGRTPGDAVEGFLSTVASVRRKDILEAVNEFITIGEAEVSTKFHYNRAIMLRRFAGEGEIRSILRVPAFSHVKLQRARLHDSEFKLCCDELRQH